MDALTVLLLLALGLCAIYAGGHVALARGAKAPPHPLLLLVLVATLARLLFLALYPDAHGDYAYDARSYRIVAHLFRTGHDVYAGTERHPYLPFHMYLMVFSAQLEDWIGLHQFQWLRLPNIAADIGILVLIYRAAQRLGRPPAMAFWFALLWAVQPISIFISTLHGQFDSVAACFALLAWYVLRFHAGWRAALVGGIAMGLAVVDKTWPALFVPAFLLLPAGPRNRGVYLASVVAVPALFLLLYMSTIGTSFELIRDRVVGYESVPNRFGYTYAFRGYLYPFTPDGWRDFAAAHDRHVFFMTLAVVAAIVIPRRDALRAATAMVAAFLATTPGFGSQYLVWIVPFAIVSGQLRMLAAYSIAAVSGMLVYDWGACGLQCPGYFAATFLPWPLQPVWPVAVFWMLREVTLALSLPERLTFVATKARAATARL